MIQKMNAVPKMEQIENRKLVAHKGNDYILRFPILTCPNIHSSLHE